MLKTRVLTTVSMVALATAAGVGAAKADNLIIDLTAAPPTLTIAAGSSAVQIANGQIVLSGSDKSSTTNTAIGYPGSDPTKFHDVGGGTDTIIVDNVNSIFAQAGTNDVVNQIDFYAATGSGTSSAATLGSLQDSSSSIVTAAVDNSNVLAQVLDLGAGSTVRVNDNNIHSSSTVNAANNLIDGNINNAESSTELGQSVIDLTANKITSGATALVGNTQLITGAASTFSEVTDSRIGLLAQVGGVVPQPSIKGAPLDIIGNTIAASFTGNDATSAVSLTGDEAITLYGTAGVVNGQSSTGDYTFRSTVRNVAIEAGNTQDLGAGKGYNADLDSTTLTLTDNTISTSSTSNSAANTVSLADNINQSGNTVAGSQLNTVNFGPDIFTVKGDLFIQSGQFSDVSVLSDIDGGYVNVLAEDLTGSTVVADSNTIASTANGSIVTNGIDVGNTAVFDSVVAINSVQYTEGSQTANNDSELTVDLAHNGVNANTAAGDVKSSSITVDSNTLSSEAMGNSHASTLNIKGTTITGPGGSPGDIIDINRTTVSGDVSADYSILNGQVLDGGSAVADVLTAINVDVADINFTTASLSVSNNDIHGMSIGNLSTEASIAIDATTLTGQAGVANVQTVEDSASLSSTIAPNEPAFIDVDVGAGDGAKAVTVKDAAVNVDSNTFNSRVWGNLADSTTNSITISGVTIGDGGESLPYATVDRTAAVPNTAVDAGFALANDQSVEDLNASVVTAGATGDLINVNVGDITDISSVTDSNVTASSNSATTSATLNQATDKLGIDAVALDGSSVLSNVQTLADQDGTLGSAAMAVSQNDLDITIDVSGGDALMTNNTVQADTNSLLASARINLATNSVSVKSQTETIGSVYDATANPTTVDLAATSPTVSTAAAEHLLINDQSFAAPSAGGIKSSMFDNDITVDININGNDLTNSVVEASGNSMTTIAAGNDATNSLGYDVGSVDLTTADDNGGAPIKGNGPIASIVSNQTGTAGTSTAGFTASNSGTTISVDLDTTDTYAIDGVQAGVNGNSIRTLARTNNVSNVLTASGTTVLNDANPDPLATLGDKGSTIALDNTAFAVASRQVNSVAVNSAITGATINVATIDQGNGGSMDGTALSADSNLVVAEARGNDAGNGLSTDFVDNAAQATVANSQSAADLGTSYTSSVTGTEISVTSDVDPTDAGHVVASSMSASGNAVAALSSANRATNVLNAGGTNITMRNGDNVTSADPNGPMTSDAALGVFNMQGTPTGGLPVDVSASVIGTLIGVGSNDVFDSGSIKADSNLILAQAVEHSATNTLNITASANIDSQGVIDETPGASVASQQTVSPLSDVTAVVNAAAIGAVTDDPRGPGSFAATASSNQVLASAIGGTANNTLTATAGAEINNRYSSAPVVGNGIAGTPTVLDAGFNVLNMQNADRATFTATVDTLGIVAGAAEDYNNDSVNVNSNVVQAQATAFQAVNILTLDAGSSSNASAALANSQVVVGSLVSAGIDTVVILTGNLDEGAIDSSLTVKDNTVQALASGNKATNTMTSTAAATLQESSGAGAVINPGATPTPITVTGSDYTVLNYQITSGATINASITDVGVGIDGLNATTGVDDSALNVSGNQVLASSVGNDAVNSLVLNSGTFQHPSATVANLQGNNGTTVSASVDGAAIGIGGALTLAATSSNSSFTVQGNSIGASAIGNRAVNTLTSGN
ncbi:MAG: hypothetical protein GC201_07950 [Alphaproteobacteria bacterium]|nr:hypothetical protein [Alphaproteobacteria bacterium]